MQSNSRDSVGSSVSLPLIGAGAVVLLALAIGGYRWLWATPATDARKVTIATGSASGAYHAMGIALERILEKHKVVASADVLTTAGSAENMAKVEDGTASFALVQSDTAPGQNVRLVAPLYDELVHIVARRGSCLGLADLAGKKVGVGPAGSGTQQIAERILAHFGIAADRVTCSSDECIARLRETQPGKEQLDAVFLLRPLPSPTIAQLGGRRAVQFVSIGEPGIEGSIAHALETVFPSMRRAMIPRQTYGDLPGAPVQTLAVGALLVASQKTPDKLVRDVAEALFEHRLEIANASDGEVSDSARRVANGLRENYDPAHAPLPVHAGAVAYFQRDQPAFLVEYAEAISLLMTVAVALFSGAIALREWLRRSRKNRIDAYYIEVRNLTVELDGCDDERLRGVQEELRQVRQRAFADLVVEKVDADESFTIFQDYLMGELETIDRRLGGAA